METNELNNKHIHEKDEDENPRALIARLGIAGGLFAAALFAPFEAMFPNGYLPAIRFAAFFLPYLIAGYDVVARAAKNIARGQMFDESLLMSIATLGAFALAVFPSGTEHFAEAVAVMLLYQLGELIQDFAVDKSRDSIKELLDISPEYATVMNEDRLIRVEPTSVKPGQTIVVLPGERIPLDGRVEQGQSAIDASALTGESIPQHLGPGSPVYSGSINLTGKLTIVVQKEYCNSTVARILTLVEESSEKKAATESFITRFARWYTPFVVAAAFVISVLPPLLTGMPFVTWIERGLVFLVASCPCALIISVPLSFFAGMGAASRQGILIKGGTYLEGLAHIKALALDKTGTLTTGRFRVKTILPVQGVSCDTVLFAAACAEHFSTHPLALSVQEAWTGTLDVSNVNEVQEHGGKGVSALVNGRRVLVGNVKLMEEKKVEVPSAAANGEAWRKDGTVLFVAEDQHLLGAIYLEDALKDDAYSTIKELRQLGVDTISLLTGDSPAAAQFVAKQLGFDEVAAGLLPQDKTARLEQLMEATQETTRESAREATQEETQESAAVLQTRFAGRSIREEAALHGRGLQAKRKAPKHTVAFVGDGINDAPSLMQADVGIAMGALGSDAAIEAADVVLMDDRLCGICSAIRIAKRTLRIVKQNVVITLGVKLTVLAFAVFGLAGMWMAVVADVGVALLAVANALRVMSDGAKRSAS